MRGKRGADEALRLVFEPVYRPVHYLLPALVYLTGAVVLLQLFLAGWSLSALAGTGVLVLFLPLLAGVGHIRQIVFGECLVVVRGVLRDRYYNYSDFSVLAGDGSRFPCAAHWRNREAFICSIAEMRAQGVFGESGSDEG